MPIQPAVVEAVDHDSAVIQAEALLAEREGEAVTIIQTTELTALAGASEPIRLDAAETSKADPPATVAETCPSCGGLLERTTGGDMRCAECDGSWTEAELRIARAGA